MKESDGSTSTGNNKAVTTEEAVNKIVAKPTPVFLALLVGVMSFQTMKAMVAYFPNFGGYVPYSEWRCESGSETCYTRVNEFAEQGWHAWPGDDKLLYMDSRCSIKLRHIDSNKATVTLLGTQRNVIGSIIYKLSDTPTITVTSNSSCNIGSLTDLCKKVFTPDFDVTVTDEDVECEVRFGGRKLEEQDNVVICNEVRVELDTSEGIVYSLRDAGATVRFLSALGIGEYQLNCPVSDQYNKENLCGVDSQTALELNKDFHWYTKGRTSFSTDWNLHCDGEFLRSMLGSVFFAGALLGTFFGGNLYDVIGRKKGALVGYCFVTISSLVAAFSPSIAFLFVCRFFQGAGAYIGSTGGFVLILEYTPSQYRVQVNVAIQFFFAVGYLINTFFGYFVKDWHWLVAIDGILFVLSLVPLLLLPDSPRYFLVNKGDEESAKSSLRWLARINRSNFNVDEVQLDDNTNSVEEDQPGFLETMKDFLKYRELRIQLIIQMWMWLVAGFLYYGFSFGWAELGDNIYISYLFAAVGEIIAYLAMIFPIKYWGRRVATMLFYLAGSVTFLIALIPYNLAGTFTVEQLSCLIGSMFVSAAFAAIYLYSVELAPTSHRGKMLGYCSFAARIGSFGGPQASLLFSWNRTATLVLFTVLAASAGALIYRLPETGNVPTPNTAVQVQERREGKLRYVEGGVENTVENKLAS